MKISSSVLRQTVEMQRGKFHAKDLRALVKLAKEQGGGEVSDTNKGLIGDLVAAKRRARGDQITDKAVDEYKQLVRSEGFPRLKSIDESMWGAS